MTLEDVRLVLSLLAKDLGETRRFYESIGFRCCGESEGWMEMRQARAVLRFYAEPPLNTPPAPCLSGVVYLHVEDVDAHAAALGGKARFEWGPETMDYGMREFAVRDPNGYLLAFTAPAP